MKRVLFTIALLTFMVKSNAQAVEKVKTIQSYFDLMEEEWICDFNPSYQKYVDIRNGFLSFRSLKNEMEPIFQMALFKDFKGKDLIVIQLPGYACGDIFACASTEERKTLLLKWNKKLGLFQLEE